MPSILTGGLAVSTATAASMTTAASGQTLSTTWAKSAPLPWVPGMNMPTS